jgi:predicted enzyme related to lactoylglutathione lyase
MTDAAVAPDASASTAPSVTFGFVKFVVGDLAAMEAFYGRAFGLVSGQTVETPELVEKILRKPGAQQGFSLILYHPKTAAAAVDVGTAYGPLGLFVRDVDAAYAHAVAQGASAHRPPQDFGTMRVAFVLDPEGREIEIVSMKG